MHQDLVHFVQTCFASSVVPNQLNSTVLVLIPKVLYPELISQFRPINLCTILYKLITKIIVNRLKIILPQIIAPTQSSFAPHR